MTVQQQSEPATESTEQAQRRRLDRHRRRKVDNPEDYKAKPLEGGPSDPDAKADRC